LVLNALPIAAPANGNGHGAAPAPSSPVSLKEGEPAPELRLPDLTGKLVDLADFRGSQTLVLFWNPGCGFCQRMLEDVKRWEARPPQGAPQLLVVSTGTVEANEALGLRSPVLLDEGFHAGSTFGANGTPMAVLIDAEGKIASQVAAGAQAVLALAGHQQDTTVPA
jgi:peroxiredoxin